ncbi:hypothetical protein GAPWKB11_1405 [Gilliamella apicola]|nr:hypothetical protein GAPWKB11_1405 [Gilliamella apicola]
MQGDGIVLYCKKYLLKLPLTAMTEFFHVENCWVFFHIFRAQQLT